MNSNDPPISPPPPGRLPKTVVALGWVSLLTDVASEMIYPLLPRFLVHTLKAGPIGLGLIEGLAESTAALLKLPSGVLSDRMRRRKPLILAGYGLAGLVRPLMGLAVLPWHALAIRMTDRLGKGVRGAPRDALIADVTPPAHRGRAFGFHRAMDHAGAALGPLLAYLFLTIWPGEYRTLFLLTIVPGIAVVLVLLFGVRERDRGGPTPTAATAAPSTTAVKSRWRLRHFDRRFGLYMAALTLFVLGNSTDMFLLLRADELGLPPVYLTLLWSGFHVAKSLANLAGGRWADRFDARALLLAGWLVYAAVYLGFGLATSVTQVVALFFAYAAYYGLTEPAEKALVARWSPADIRGAGFGWYNLVLGLGALPASLIFGWLWQSSWGAKGAFGFGAALALASCGLLAATFLVPPHATDRSTAE